MKINFQKNLSGHNLALATILVASILGLVMKPNEKHIPPYKWALLFTGTMSATGLLCLFAEDSINQILEDNKPDHPTGNSEDDRGSRSSDVHVHTHVILPASFDEKLEIVAKDVAEIAQRMGALDMALAKQLSAIKPKELTVKEKEQQARYALIARLSDLGTDSSPVDALQGAIQICSDARLWEHPARTPTVHIDTQRFYNEGKIWPTIRDNHIVWSLDPDYDPSDETDEVEQTPFRPFRCCSRCKYIGKYYDCCAVVPFGCGTGDSSEECREFERKDDGTPVPELTIDDFPY